MTEQERLLEALDSAQWELSEGLQGIPDEDVWKRPDPRLLSVGELAAHVAYWEAQSFFGDGFESPLVQTAARYYSSSVDEPFGLAMNGEAVLAEIARVHEACKAAFLASPPEMSEKNLHRGDWTWGYTLQYQAFHVAYHAGQIYSVRHLLGHTSPDN